MVSPAPSTNPVRPITQADLDEHNIQGLVELSYVKTANDVLADSLTSLQSALNLTNDVLTTLTGLQGAHNKLVVSGKGQFQFDFDRTDLDPDDYAGEYSNAASGFFGTPIVPKFAFVSAGDVIIIGSTTPNPVSQTFTQFASSLVAYQAQLTAQIPLLSAVTPTLPDGSPDPNALLARIRTVLADLNRHSPLTDYESVKAWVLDSYDAAGDTSVANAGLIQQNLTFAVTAGQSLNNTQAETVRRYLFLFEEYYKSASSILQAITQIIQKMADGITTT